jgi:hypothetical protein
MSAISQRAIDIPVAVQTDDGEIILTPDELYAALERWGPVLVEVGGTLTLTAERVQVGELAGEPVAVTSRVVGRWQARSSLIRSEQPETEAPADA